MVINRRTLETFVHENFIIFFLMTPGVVLKEEMPKVRSILIWMSVCSYCGTYHNGPLKVKKEVRKIFMDRTGNC